jgi:hypothetical protein
LPSAFPPYPSYFVNHLLKEIRRKALTRRLNELKMPLDFFSGYGDLCLTQQYIMGRAERPEGRVMTAWDEGYEDVSILSLSLNT